ncbi:hypothetical protein H9S92_12345 [Lewinella lacunae]|uniref:Uncharacterized protein n=2 Tax=Neolewinella lacunae TaxID=1517758 RepID=A0A923T7W5_9BACT|nr:hypothetical protein [Neolewinella lacunae]
MWFENLTGFKEESPANVREKILVEGDTLLSTVNHRRFTFGQLEVLSLEELRQSSPPLSAYRGKLLLSEVVGDVQAMHAQAANAHALFQAASQFNLLEMIGPNVTPERGIDRYEEDFTQGPACAIACGAGTIYRNYFVRVGEQIGQSADKQIDCLAGIGRELDNENLHLWSMKNGYALANEQGLLTINKKLSALSHAQREDLKGKLQVGVQWNTEVTLNDGQQKVSQIYCSALPVAYSQVEPMYWERFARIVLEATYEATFFAAVRNLESHGSNVLYLTLVGGGAFGNEVDWILESLEKAASKFREVPLDVRIVSYGKPNPRLGPFINALTEK